MKILNKLSFYEVLSVTSSRNKRIWERMMPTTLARIGVGPVPPGYYRVTKEGLYLPKRRRGEKFVVRYTAVKEVEL